MLVVVRVLLVVVLAHPSVDQLVSLQVVWPTEGLPANVALVRPLPRVGKHVRLKVGLFAEYLLADLARVLQPLGVDLLVCLQVDQEGERLVAADTGESLVWLVGVCDDLFLGERAFEKGVRVRSGAGLCPAVHHHSFPAEKRHA